MDNKQQPTQQEQQSALPSTEVTKDVSVLGQAFELRQREAKALALSSLLPKEFQNNIPNCLIAMEMANRMGLPALMVAQNLDIIHGKPTFSSKFLIASVNTCGKFSPLRFRQTGEKGTDTWGCIAYATELATGDILEGAEVTIKMAKDEGWYSKAGSKWKTIPELMLQYRAGAFFSRVYTPELGMGMMTSEEIHDITHLQSNEVASKLQQMKAEQVAQEVEILSQEEND